MPVRIGVTGGIGSGKSIVSQVLRTMGYPVYDSDQRAKELMETDAVIREALLAAFGPETFRAGQLNRPFLAEQIFRDPAQRETINKIVHPVVRADFQAWAEAQKSTLVFQESALLFETGGYRLLDKTILVTAPQEERIRRVMARDQAKEEDVRARMEAQLPDEQKIPLADAVIDNRDGALVLPQINEILQRMNVL